VTDTTAPGPPDAGESDAPRSARELVLDHLELFTALLKATAGHIARNQPRGTGITDLTMVKSMIANGADLDLDILPVLCRHADELAQRPLESWTTSWFVTGVAKSHRQRITAAQKPAVPAIDDAESLTKLLDATGENYLSGARGIFDLAPIHAMLAAGVTVDDILSTLRSKVDRRVTKYAATLNS